jgi:hypothetical protein
MGKLISWFFPLSNCDMNIYSDRASNQIKERIMAYEMNKLSSVIVTNILVMFQDENALLQQGIYLFPSQYISSQACCG